jgi:ElaB/YqjD/DUF883 family membrane-anchored ribosome-binding protein
MDKNQLQEKFGEKAHELNERLSSEYRKFMDNLEVNRARTRRYVHDNPEKAMLISLGAGIATGLAIAMIIRRRGK